MNKCRKRVAIYLPNKSVIICVQEFERIFKAMHPLTRAKGQASAPYLGTPGRAIYAYPTCVEVTSLIIVG